MDPTLSRSIKPPAQMPDFASPSSRAWSSLLLVALIAAGFVLAAFVSQVAVPSVAALFQPVSLGSPAGWCALVSACALALVLHECGHLVASLSCGFELLTVSLGPVRLSRGQLRWEFRLNKSRLFAGSVTAIPRTNELWRERMLSVVAAGPAATLITSLLAGCLLKAHAVPALAIPFTSAFIQISFLIFVLGLVPNSPKSRIQNDATLFLILWRDGKEANEIFLYHLVLQLQMAGIEPRSFPLWLIELMAAFQGRPDFMVLYADMIASWAFDRGDSTAGDQWDERALALAQHGSWASRNASLANSACFDLVFRDNRAAAREKLSRIQVESIISPALRHRTLAARHLALGHIASSLAQVFAARTALPRGFGSGGLEHFLLKRLHASAVSTR